MERKIEIRKNDTGPNSRLITRDGQTIGFISHPLGEKPCVTLITPEGFIKLTQEEIESLNEIISSMKEERESKPYKQSFI